jgi:hypothetical protein
MKWNTIALFHLPTSADDARDPLMWNAAHARAWR